MYLSNFDTNGSSIGPFGIVGLSFAAVVVMFFLYNMSLRLV